MIGRNFSIFLLLLQIIQNGPIRENKWLKPKFETFFEDFVFISLFQL